MTIKIEDWSKSWQGYVGTINFDQAKGKITVNLQWNGRHGQKGDKNSGEMEKGGQHCLGSSTIHYSLKETDIPLWVNVLEYPVLARAVCKDYNNQIEQLKLRLGSFRAIEDDNFRASCKDYIDILIGLINEERARLVYKYSKSIEIYLAEVPDVSFVTQ